MTMRRQGVIGHILGTYNQTRSVVRLDMQRGNALGTPIGFKSDIGGCFRLSSGKEYQVYSKQTLHLALLDQKISTYFLNIGEAQLSLVSAITS